MIEAIKESLGASKDIEADLDFSGFVIGRNGKKRIVKAPESPSDFEARKDEKLGAGVWSICTEVE